MPATIFGLPEGVFLLWTSASFFLLASILILKPLFETRDDFMIAFFAWLLGMGLLHVFLGEGFRTNQLVLLHIGIFFGFTGSAYLLRLPLKRLVPKFEKIIFYTVLLIGWAIVAWMSLWQEVHTTKLMLQLLFGYMIVVAGILPSIYLIWVGIKAKSKGVRFKGIWGGIGIISCCLLADLLVLFIFMSVAVWSEFFMAIAPVILVVAVIEKKSPPPMNMKST